MSRFPRSTSVKGLSRRDLLRALGLGAGGLLFAPLLARIASAGTPPPARFVVIGEGDGV